jgi:hypothetical protein
VRYVVEQGFVRYLLETGVCEVCTGNRAWRGTCWRQGFVRYLMETGLFEILPGDRAL